MAELADALDSGSSRSNSVEVQVLLPAPKNKDYRKVVLVFSFIEEGRGLEGPVVNDCRWQSEPGTAPARRRGKSSCPHQNKDYRKVVLIFSFIEEGRGLEGPEVNEISKIKI